MNSNSLSCPSILSYILCLFCSSDYAQNVSKNLENKNAPEPYDVIIVPGVPYLDPNFQLVLKARILWSKYLYDSKITKNIIYSGSSVYSPFVEGIVMRIYSDSLKIPTEHTFSETHAEHSTENIYYSVLMAKQLGYKKIAIATDQYQALILSRYVKKNFPEVKIIPIEYKKIDVLKIVLPEIDATKAFVPNFVSIVFRENRLKRFKGTLGMNIKKDRDSLNYQSTQSVAGLDKFVNPNGNHAPDLSLNNFKKVEP